MSSIHSIFRRFAAAASLVVLAACSSSGSTGTAGGGALPYAGAAAENGPALSPLAATGSTLYVADFTTGVDVYNAAGDLQSLVSDGIDNPAWGLAVDPATQTTYVANSLCCITAYAPGTPYPAGFYDISGYGQFASGSIAAGNKKLYLAYNVSCYPSFPSCKDARSSATGVILVYPLLPRPEGRSKPLEVLRTPSGTHAMGIAVDAKNNLYVEYAQSIDQWPVPAYIERFSPGSTTPKKLKIKLGNGGSNIALDSKGDLIACDQVPAHIDIFAPGASTPTRTIGAGMKNCSAFALSADEKRLYASNQPIVELSPGFPGVVSVYNYANGKLEKTISQGLNPTSSIVSAVAVSPPAPLGQPY